MLTTLIRRLTLTGLLVTGIVGTGLLFGQVSRAPTQADNFLEITINVGDKTVKSSEKIDSLSDTRQSRHGAQPGWPLFSFGKRRSARSW